MKKSICCIALALVMALSTVGLFASCAKEKEKTLVMATNANFPPYEYKDGAAFAGIDVELAQAIADKLGMKLEIQDGRGVEGSFLIVSCDERRHGRHDRHRGP